MFRHAIGLRSANPATDRISAPAARAAVVPLLGALLAAGCGVYSFSGTSLPSHIKTIAVPIFDNETLEPDIADDLTDSISERFLQDNRLKVVGESRADCVLEGSVLTYDNRVYNYSANEVPQDYILVLKIDAKLRDARKGRDLWEEKGLTATATYPATGDSGGVAGEESARSRAMGEIAEDILARTMEQW